MLATINSTCAPVFTATPSGSGLLSIGEAASLTGLSVSHLRKLSNRGAIPTFTTATGGHRRFSREALGQFLGADFSCFNEEEQEGASVDCGATTNKVALLARVSSHKQGTGFDTGNGSRKAGDDRESDLERQVKQLREYAKGKFGTEGSLYSDIGSGLNFTRRNFIKLLEEVCQGKWNGGTIVVTHRDRAMRYGWEMLETVCKVHGVSLDVMDKANEVSDEQELADDVLSIITHFSAKKHGLRAAKNNSVNLTDEGMERLSELRRSGYNARFCLKQLRSEGYFSVNGRNETKPLTLWTVQKLIALESGKVVEAYAGDGLEQERTSVESWGEAHLEKTGCETDRLSMKAVRKAYHNYCAAHGEIPVSVVVLGHYLKGRGFKRYEVNGCAFYRFAKLV